MKTFIVAAGVDVNNPKLLNIIHFTNEDQASYVGCVGIGDKQKGKGLNTSIEVGTGAQHGHCC